MSQTAKTTSVADDGSEVLALRSTEVGADRAAGAPTRVLVAPWGVVESSAGTFIVDQDSATAAVEAFSSQGVDLPVDYEHQTLGGEFAAPSGQAPAAGWIRRLEAIEGVGIFADVTWTPAAMAQLAAREYRYLSPVAIVRKSDRKLVALHSVALTNKPAIVGMQPIVNRQHASNRKETDVMDEQAEALRDALGLDPGVATEEVLVAAKERIESQTREMAQRDAEEVVVTALRAGKLTEAQREWAIELAATDRAGFDAWEEAAPVIVTPGRTEPPDATAGDDRTRRVVAARARTEFRNHPELEMVTSEAAYVADAVRQAGLPAEPTA